MAKTKHKNVHVPLVVAGYTLFTLLIIATIASVVYPWGQILIENFSRVSHYNLAIFLVALTLGAFLPVLVGYLIGDRSIKTKSKVSRHFNGVLFGLLAFWVMTTITVLVSVPIEAFQTQPNARVVVVNLVPSFIVAILTAVLALLHVRSTRAREDVVSYKPFSLLLIALILLLPVWSLINNIVTNSLSIDTFIPLISIVALGIVSFATIRNKKMTPYTKMVWSAISVSVFFVASFVASQLILGWLVNYLFQPDFKMYELLRWSSLCVAVAGWAVFWLYQARTLSAHKR